MRLRRATRRCRSFQSRPAVAAALELPKSISKSKSNAKAAAKQARATRGQRRVARALASISVICGFLNQFSVPLLKHNLGAKPLSARKKRSRGQLLLKRSTAAMPRSGRMPSGEEAAAFSGSYSPKISGWAIDAIASIPSTIRGPPRSMMSALTA